MTQTKNRGYVFTLNNYTDEDCIRLETLTARYIIFGFEEAPTTGTPHLQGFVYYKNAVTFNRAKADIGAQAHIEVSRGTPTEASEYCKKSNKFTEIGDLPVKGKRTDLEEFTKRIRTDPDFDNVCDKAEGGIQLKYFGNARDYHKHCHRTRQVRFDSDRVVIWIWGSTGTGKTRKALEISQPGTSCMVEHFPWFDPYSGEDTIILDDLRPDSLKPEQLLRVLDKYVRHVPIKGGFVEFKPKRVIVTSIYPPTQEFMRNEDLNQLKRRITQEINLH